MNDAEPESHGSTTPAPTRTMWADTSQLYESAHTWQWAISDELYAAANQTNAGLGQGYLCGLAMSAVWGCHDAFVQHTVDQLMVGTATAAEMGARLRRTADEWVRTDEGAAEAAGRLRSLL